MDVALDGVGITIDVEAVVVVADRPLTVLSSGVVGGGLGTARAIVNLHVGRDHPWHAGDDVLERFVAARRLPGPWVGLLTSAWTEKARVASATADGIAAMAVATVGLGNRVTAGVTPPAGPGAPATINLVVVVDAEPEPAALVNAVVTVTEVKVRALALAGLRGPEREPATGTSTDAVVIAATGRGPRARFGGPISHLGWVVSRAAADVLEAGVRDWVEANP